MEGRINRDSLTEDAVKPTTDYTRRSYGEYTPRRAVKSQRGDYRRRYRGPSRELLPEGKDMVMVQFLASGILLLFVMFVALIPSSQTNGVKTKLKEAFSYNMSVSEAVGHINAIKDGFSDDNREIPDEEPADAAADDTVKNPEAIYDDIAVDSEMLKELKDKAAKN